ncbi:MAG TPA: hypothetical protein VN699_08540 [Pirellulales bacterium]|nr:hypothetical protein [Pirellulales bacterium]
MILNDTSPMQIFALSSRMLRGFPVDAETLGRLRPAPWCCLAFALLLASGAQPVLAACGDYVMIGHHAYMHTAAATDPSPASDSPYSENAVGESAPPKCHGPNCGRQAPSAPQPLPASPSFGIDQWACCSSAMTLELGACDRRLPETAVSLAAGFRSIPEHPPRA